ncbi:MAG: DUF98 domain-containing protein [Magnetococcales bacterium]|nr:DUF98 domain-containing protein [Magnetococcales bacterium]
MLLPFDFRLREAWDDPVIALKRGDAVLTELFRGALTSTASLTRVLEESWGGPVRVRLERQRVQEELPEDGLLWGECHHLSGPGRFLLRDAWLGHGETEGMFAHSEMRVEGLSPAVLSEVNRGQSPLGLLFPEEGKRVRRLALQVTRGDSVQLTTRLGLPGPCPFWCRRSLFCVDETVVARIFELFPREW